MTTLPHRARASESYYRTRRDDFVAETALARPLPEKIVR